MLLKMNGRILGALLGLIALGATSFAEDTVSVGVEVLERLEQLEKKHVLLEKKQVESDAEILRLQRLTAAQTVTIQKLQSETRHSYRVNESNNQRLKRQTVEPKQAFTAYNDRAYHPPDGDILRFDRTLTNEGNGYNTNTGIFTCNQDGLYMFAYTIGEFGANMYVWAELKVNGVRKLDAVAETYHSHQDVQGVNMAVLRLQSGDQVWVATKLSNQLPGDDAHRISTFTGLFLYK